MKWYNLAEKMALVLVVLCGLACLFLGIFWGKSIGGRKAQITEQRFLSIESRLDVRALIDSVLITHINGIYEYLVVGMMEEIRSVKQDTTIDSFWGPDPIPPPAGFEMRIKRSIYQKIKKPIKGEWNPETKKWEKSK